MRILVTGHQGFIGRNMMEWLSADNFFEVDGWSYDPDNLPDVKNYQYVIHLGAETDTSDQDVDTIIHKNLEFSQWLFCECNRNKVHFQYASTSQVYGNTNNFSEFAPCHPNTPYSWSKYLFDRWVFQQPHNIFVQGFRYFNVYGKYMHLRGPRADILYNWREQAKNTGYIELWSNSMHIKRDWVWVGDICRLHIDFIKTVNGSGIWNVGTGLSHSYWDLADEIANQESAELKYIEPKITEQYNSRADLTYLKSTIGRRQWLNVYEWLSG